MAIDYTDTNNSNNVIFWDGSPSSSKYISRISSVTLDNTQGTGWLGYFDATTTTNESFTVSFDYQALTGSESISFDNDGIMDNSYNTSITATTTRQNYTGSVTHTAAGNIRFYFKYTNSPTNTVVISNFKFYPTTSNGKDITDSWIHYLAAVSQVNIQWDKYESGPLIFKRVYTHGFLGAGYKSSTPWSTVEKTAHSTETTTVVGDILDRSGAYVDGGWGDYYAYIYNMKNALNTAGSVTNYTSSFSMSTQTGRAHQSAWDTTARQEGSVLLMPELNMAYITGGTIASTDKHNYVTETMSLAVSGLNHTGSNAVNQSTAMYGETCGFLIANSTTAQFTFATETWGAQNAAMSSSSDGHSKILNSKHGYGWGKNGSNTSSANLTKWSNVTGTSYGIVATTPTSSGEENNQVGQINGYCLGLYDGTQNNTSYRMSYLTDTVTTLGTGAQPSGHDGNSSGACASASSQFVGGP